MLLLAVIAVIMLLTLGGLLAAEARRLSTLLVACSAERETGAGWRERSSCEAAPEGRARGVVSLR